MAESFIKIGLLMLPEHNQFRIDSISQAVH